MKWNETNYPRIGETVLRTTLPNGLTVAVVPKPLYRKRYAFFTMRYGGMDMRFRLDGVWHDTPAGIAHYLEHKMFDLPEGGAMEQFAAHEGHALIEYGHPCHAHHGVPEHRGHHYAPAKPQPHHPYGPRAPAGPRPRGRGRQAQWQHLSG